MAKKDKKKTKETAPRRPGPRGWPGRGGGMATMVQMAPEWRGTTVQVCGLWPFAVGTGAPMIGVPIGRNLQSGATVCCDPISWFQRAHLISNPSVFVLGKPGLGKSTVIRRMATGLAGYGVQPLVLGDLKPDYVDLIEALGGQVITLGRGRGHLNILDPGEAKAAAQRLTGRARAQILADAHGRRHTMVSALLTIVRLSPFTDREETILDRALKVLDDRHDGVPVLADLLKVIQDALKRCATSRLTEDPSTATGKSQKAWKPPSSGSSAVDGWGRSSPGPPRTLCGATAPSSSTFPRSTTLRPTSKQLCCWPAGLRDSAPSTLPTPSLTLVWNPGGTTSSSSTSCGGPSVPARAWSTGSTP